MSAAPAPAPAPAPAARVDDAQFASEFDRGLQAEREGDPARAGTHYERALARAEQLNERTPVLRSLLALGWVHYVLKDPLRSVEYLKRAVADPALPKDRARDAKALIDAQMKLLGHLRIEVAPPAGDASPVEITVDGREVADAADVPVTVGRHEVRATASGFHELTQSVAVSAGESQLVSAVLVREESSNGMRTAAWIVGGVAALSLAVGIGTGIYSWVKHDQSDCEPAECTAEERDARDAAIVAGNVSTATWITAGVAAGVSAYLFWQSSDGSSETRVSASLTGVSFVHRF